MTKQDVIRRVAEKTGFDPLTTRLVTEAFFEIVKESLSQGEPIYIRQFGSFLLKQRAQKVGRHIRQNTTVTIAAHVIPAFKPSAEFSDRVRAQDVPIKKQKERS